MLAARVFPGTQVQARLASGGLASGPVATHLWRGRWQADTLGSCDECQPDQSVQCLVPATCSAAGLGMGFQAVFSEHYCSSGGAAALGVRPPASLWPGSKEGRTTRLQPNATGGAIMLLRLMSRVGERETGFKGFSQRLRSISGKETAS